MDTNISEEYNTSIYRLEVKIPKVFKLKNIYIAVFWVITLCFVVSGYPEDRESMFLRNV
jgi:hypothetical protein